MKMKKFILVTGAVILSSTLMFAQDANKASDSGKSSGTVFKTLNVGVNAGSMLFYGDIRQYDWAPITSYHNELGWGGGLTVTKSFSNVLGLQGQLLFGTLAGTKRGMQDTVKKWYPNGSYFNASVFEYCINGIFNFTNISFSGSTKPRKITAYALAGIGLTNFKTERKSLLEDTRVNSFGYVADKDGKIKRTTETVLPIGLGMKYKINNQFDLGLEITLRNVNSDKLDASVVNKTARDKYGYTNLNLTYKLGAGDESIDWVNPFDQMWTEMSNVKDRMDKMSADKDHDGVSDVFDKDNATPDSVKVYGDGTSVDSDFDGVPDSKDADPFSAKGAKVDANGKEMDSDGDGVTDGKDLEPNTEKGKLVNFQGITIKVSESTGYDTYMPVVFFDFNKDNIKDTYHEGLAALARLMYAHPETKISLYGNCDAVGTEAVNKELGQKRADAVKKYLMDVYGLDGSRIEAISKGKGEPMANVKNAKDKDPLNRRVDYKVVK